MPSSKILRGRGAVTTVTAYGEVLFAPGSPVNIWKNRLSNAVTTAARGFAPTNKRPRWDHYGEPLKTTIHSRTDTDIVSGGGRFYIAVGSTAHYAYFVDQGTGVYNGSSPWAAALLPPRTRGGPDLYEAAWARRFGIRQVMIRGQEGQKFFEKGLDAGFTAMRLRPSASSALSSALDPGRFPDGLAADFSGATPVDAGFKEQREKWRAWRKAHWDAVREEQQAAARARRSEREAERRAAKAAKDAEKKKKKRNGPRSVSGKQADALKEFKRRNPRAVITKKTARGIFVRIPGRGQTFLSWESLLGML